MKGEELAADAAGADRPSPRADLVWSLAWIAVGVAMFTAGFTMDRLERQHINPYTAPGLVPALLGIGILALGAFLLTRSVRRGGFANADGGGAPPDGRRLDRRGPAHQRGERHQGGTDRSARHAHGAGLHSNQRHFPGTQEGCPNCSP